MEAIRPHALVEVTRLDRRLDVVHGEAECALRTGELFHKVLINLHGGLRLLVYVLEVLGDLLIHLGFVIGNFPVVVDDGFHHRVAVLDSQHPLGGGIELFHIFRVIVPFEVV